MNWDQLKGKLTRLSAAALGGAGVGAARGGPGKAGTQGPAPTPSSREHRHSSRTIPFTLPAGIVEIQPGFVVGVRLAGKTAGKANGSARPTGRVRSIGVAGFDAETLTPLPNRPNIANEADLSRALQAVAEVIGNGTGRFGLVVPDGMVRVGILSFETLPASPKEADALVRWRMKDNLPFPPEEARLSYQVTWRGPERVEVLALAAQSDVLAEYETALEQINGGTVLILPATLTLLPLLPEADRVGQLLIHVCSGWITNAVVTGSRLRLWRTRQLGPASELTPDQISEAVSEVARVVASSRDRLQVDIGRIWLCARPPAVSEAGAELGSELARALSREVDPLMPNSDFAAALPNDDRVLFERYGATIAGLVENTCE